MMDTARVTTTALGIVLLVGGGSLLAVQVHATGHVEGVTAYIGAGAALLGAFCVSPDAIVSFVRTVGGYLPWAKARATTAVPAVKDDAKDPG